MSRAETAPGILARATALGLVFIVPILAWPGAGAPFSTPKLWTLAGGSLVILALSALTRDAGARLAATPRIVRWAALAWVASFAWSGILAPHVRREALVLGLAGPLFWAALVTSGATARDVMRAWALAAAAVSAVTLAQWLRADPFVLAGWTPEIAGASGRLRMYGTLGNPNFVAAWLAISVPVLVVVVRACVAERRLGAALAAAFGLTLAATAILVTGSRGGALGLAAGLAGLAAFTPGSPGRRGGWLLAAAIAAVFVLPWLSTARTLSETMAGRAYIWRATLPHLLDRPVSGWGTGAFELVYDDAQAFRDSELSRAGPFAGPQQHAHNDYLEALVERGIPGLMALCAVVVGGVVAARRALRQPRPGVAAAAGGAAVVAAAAVALVDFPFARPTEAAAVWCAAAIIALAVDERPVQREPDGSHR